MAAILAMQIEVLNTDTGNATPGVLLRTSRQTSLTVDDGTTGEGVWILGQAKLEELVNQVGDDALEQMKVAERNARLMEARGEI